MVALSLHLCKPYIPGYASLWQCPRGGHDRASVFPGTCKQLHACRQSDRQTYSEYRTTPIDWIESPESACSWLRTNPLPHNRNEFEIIFLSFLSRSDQNSEASSGSSDLASLAFCSCRCWTPCNNRGENGGRSRTSPSIIVNFVLRLSFCIFLLISDFFASDG